MATSSSPAAELGPLIERLADRFGPVEIGTATPSMLLSLLQSLFAALGEKAPMAADRAHAVALADACRLGQETVATAPCFDLLGHKLALVRAEIEAALHEASNAANAIISSAEALLASDGTEDNTTEVLRILEACNFQDISGQRLTKALHAIAFIDARLARGASRDTCQDPGDDVPSPEEAEREAWERANLVHGPASSDEALGQDEIDKLFG